MLHNIIIYIWIVCVTIVLGLVCIAISFVDATGNAIHAVVKGWARSILWISGMRVKINGLDRLDPDRSYIFMANHQSNFDIPVLLGTMTIQTRWLAKAELFKIPIFGRAMRRAGFISIDRSNRESAFRSLEKAADTIRSGTSVLIFPEGTRSEDGKIRSFKKGGFVLAVDAAVPVVPVVIHGTFQVMPKNRLRIRPGPAVIDILDPIDTSGYTRANRNQLMSNIRDIMVQFQERQEG
jgi:1-acyl-sn-glycerol-3-phosphate acyltransferase